MYKNILSTLIMSTIILITASCKAQNSDAKMDSVSYSVGVLMAQSLKQQNFEDLNQAFILYSPPPLPLPSLTPLLFLFFY